VKRRADQTQGKRKGAEVVEVRPIADIVGTEYDQRTVSPLAWAIVANLYTERQLHSLRQAASGMVAKADTRFLDLKMLRGAHRFISEIREIMWDRERLELLSDIAETHLEPYPIDVAACHLNYYIAGRRPLAFHSDGAAMVELVPLDRHECDGAGTLVFNGPPDEGSALLHVKGEDHLDNKRLIHIPHHPGQSILLQGRCLLHAGATASQDRVLLVFALRSRDQPWKDGNSIARLAMDYAPSEFLDEWIEDELQQKLPALRKAHSND
jgi:hypothetical protein